MIYGFTGTRKGLTKPQAKALFSALKQASHDNWEDTLYKLGITLIHGGAEGADEVADSYACLLNFVNIEIYPCHKDRFTYWCEKGDGKIRSVHSVQQPLIRNRIIARRCYRLFATPLGMEEEQRSGTWATIRYARQERKPIVIIFPDGSERLENG